MSAITIATFNCENLFRRYRFNKNLTKEQIEKRITDGFIIDKTVLTTVNETERKLTADAIKATKADIVCLQEVENLDTLKNFVSEYLSSSGYKYRILIDANDPRLIDVAIISKLPFDCIKTHQYLKNGSTAVFSRDCLEVEFLIGGKPLTIFVNHFKSMFDKGNLTPAQKRAKTAPRRELQAQTVLDIIKKKYKNNPEKENWIIVGDLNDYPDDKTSLKKLLNSKWMENIVQTRITDPAEQWTHYWDTTSIPLDERYNQIDYIFLSKQLAAANPTAVPEIIRKGLITKAKKYTGPRFSDVTDKQGASDHCPVAVTIKL
ncbi:endonuclease/exonuclease/phosphatase family protein [Lacibacter sp.]|uniref:endonuclease/exonuclease/phosphatase family protein n=1 Tax=Lacibacter sp. TaxID=1915409 RepID=UPI002B4B7300|nr:endonuclease/exonuclease/phosphatase family protein [Lacibacter sp.]HLP36367.1 endonuclease/exonuclease/phosphatase family protein [Lacibacter sp.]